VLVFFSVRAWASGHGPCVRRPGASRPVFFRKLEGFEPLHGCFILLNYGPHSIKFLFTSIILIIHKNTSIHVNLET
jgi:hypothetical protein